MYSVDIIILKWLIKPKLLDTWHSINYKLIQGRDSILLFQTNVADTWYMMSARVLPDVSLCIITLRGNFTYGRLKAQLGNERFAWCYFYVDNISAIIFLQLQFLWLKTFLLRMIFIFYLFVIHMTHAFVKADNLYEK